MGIKSIGAAVLSLATASAFAASSSEADLKLLVYQSKLINPSGAVFVSGHNALVTQKNDGKVLLLKDGKTIGTALDLKVANKGSQGLLDIALSPKFSKDGLVYLFMTPSNKDGGAATSSVVNSYRYSPGLGKLVFRESLLKIPKAIQDTNVGGVITFNSKGKPKITAPPPAGAVINTGVVFKTGTLGTVSLVHGALPNAGAAVIGLVPSTTIKRFTGGSLTLANNFATVSLTGTGVVTGGVMELSNTGRGQMTGTRNVIVSGGTFRLGGSASIDTGTILTGISTSFGTTTVGIGTISGLIINNDGSVISGGLVSNSGDAGFWGGSGGQVVYYRTSSGVFATVTFAPSGTISTSTLTGTLSFGTQTISGANFILINHGTGTISGANYIINYGSLTTGTLSTGGLSGGTLSNVAIATQPPAPTSDGQISLVDPGSSPTDLGATGTISLGSGTIDLTTVPTQIVDAPAAPADPAPVVAEPSVVPTALSLTVVQTPEPGVVALLSSIGAGMLLRRRRRT
jgi:hypothetical protein